MKPHGAALSRARPMRAGSLTEAAAPRDSGETRDVLTFAIGDEEYALDIANIREIIKCRPITEVPRVPPFIAGIIAVRGVVMPVIDLRVRLRLPVTPIGPRSRILVVMQRAASAQKSLPAEPFGLIVDRVDHVVQLDEHDIEPPTMLSGPEAEFIAGIGRIQRADASEARHGSRDPLLAHQRTLLILLDLDRVLSFDLTGGAPHGGQASRGEASTEVLSSSKERLLR